MRSFGLLLVVAAYPTILDAQHLNLPEGTWVRLRAATLRQPHEARVSSSVPDTLRLLLDIGGPPLPVALRDIEWLEARLSPPASPRRTGAASVVGFTLGAVVGLVASALPPCSSDGPCNEKDAAERLAFVAIGGSAGALIGALLGSIPPRGGWEVLIDRRARPPNR